MNGLVGSGAGRMRPRVRAIEDIRSEEGEGL